MKRRAKAERVNYFKMRFPDEAILEYVVWKLPKPTAERPHGYKYRYYYGKDNKRLVGYDNESGKGDHKHIGANRSWVEIFRRSNIQGNWTL